MFCVSTTAIDFRSAYVMTVLNSELQGNLGKHLEQNIYLVCIKMKTVWCKKFSLNLIKPFLWEWCMGSK